jgi:hypothetical protein
MESNPMTTRTVMTQGWLIMHHVNEVDFARLASAEVGIVFVDEPT